MRGTRTHRLAVPAAAVEEGLYRTVTGAESISLGLVAGYMGGRVDAIIMRIADVQLTFPAILIALLIDGVAHGIFGAIDREVFAFYILIVSLALSFWVQYARTVRGSTMVEKNKEYVQAARVIGIPSVIIMVRHILPNVTGPVLVIATLRAEALRSLVGAHFEVGGQKQLATLNSPAANRAIGKVSPSSRARNRSGS
mgnify:CR=1 FL=1